MSRPRTTAPAAQHAGGVADPVPIPLNVGTNWPMTEAEIKARAPKLAALLSQLLSPGKVVELRALHVPSGRFSNTVSGYFNDPLKLAENALRLSATARAVYFTPNEIDPALIARRVNRCEVAGKDDRTTADADIVRRVILPVDIDPARPAGISATDAEKWAAWEVAATVRRHLATCGWPDPFVADSGNGFHLLYRIDLPTDDGGRVERCLKALAAWFDTPAAKVDKSVFNPSRIIKLPGTPGRKGDHTADRPHRTGGLIESPDPFRIVPVGLLDALAGEAPSPAKVGRVASSAGGGEFRHRLDVPKYMADFGVGILSTASGADGQNRWRVVCPFNANHRGTDAFVCQYPDGAVGYHCSHNSCSGNKWERFKAVVGQPRPDHYDPPLVAGRQKAIVPAKGVTPGRSSQLPPPATTDGEKVARGRADSSDKPAVIPQIGAASKPVLVRLSDVKREAIRWTWDRRFPCGRLSLICGHPGASKSVFSLMMAATVSTGGWWPDGTRAPCGDVLLLASEDGIADTVAPRLDVADADCSRVIALTAAQVVERDGKEKEIALTLANVDIIRDALRQMNGPKLVIVDPVGSYLGGSVDAFRDNEVREVLVPMAMLAEEFGVAVVLVCHTTKAKTTRADDGILGSRAFSGIVRATHHIGPDPNDATGRRLFFLPGKNNLGPRMTGLAYRVESASHPDPALSEQPVLLFEPDPVELGADDAFGGERGGGAGGPDGGRGPIAVKRNAAMAWLVDLLRFGPRPKATIDEEAKAAGHSARTVRTASESLGIVSYRPGMTGGYLWRLPDGFDLSEYPEPWSSVPHPVPVVAPVPGADPPDTRETTPTTPTTGENVGKLRGRTVSETTPTTERQLRQPREGGDALPLTRSTADDPFPFGANAPPGRLFDNPDQNLPD